MENASKALIIAGAILLSILIIGLGMFIYQQAANAMKDTGLSELEVSKHNDVFLNYEGVNVSGSNVRALIRKIESNNRTYANDDSLQVTWTLDSASGKTVNDIKAGKTYTVTFDYDTGSNYITKCNIKTN